MILVFTSNIVPFITFITKESIYYLFVSLHVIAIIINKSYCIRLEMSAKNSSVIAYITLSSHSVTSKPKTCFVSLFEYYINDVHSAYDSKSMGSEVFFFARLSIDDLL